jgi:hypothetical protein
MVTSAGAFVAGDARCDHVGATVERIAHGYLGDARRGTRELLCVDCGAVLRSGPVSGCEYCAGQGLGYVDGPCLVLPAAVGQGQTIAACFDCARDAESSGLDVLYGRRSSSTVEGPA